MEEKERYEIVYFDNDTSWKIIDNKTKQEVGGIDDMIKLLNHYFKRMKELEQENRDLEDDHNKLIDQYDKQYNDLCKEIQFHSSARERFVEEVKELKQQLAISEKALELACETLQDINFKLYNTEMNFVDFFKQQAQEMLENE